MTDPWNPWAVSCHRCGNVAEGSAVINGQRYCHNSSTDDCYRMTLRGAPTWNPAGEFSENLARVVHQRDDARDLAARFEEELALTLPLIKAATVWRNKSVQTTWTAEDAALTDAVDEYLEALEGEL